MPYLWLLFTTFYIIRRQLRCVSSMVVATIILTKHLSLSLIQVVKSIKCGTRPSILSNKTANFFFETKKHNKLYIISFTIEITVHMCCFIASFLFRINFYVVLCIWFLLLCFVIAFLVYIYLYFVYRFYVVVVIFCFVFQFVSKYLLI